MEVDEHVVHDEMSSSSHVQPEGSLEIVGLAMVNSGIYMVCEKDSLENPPFETVRKWRF